MISQQLINLVELSEGFKESPYRDTGGIPTIGFGFTHYSDGRPVTMNDAPITREQGESMLEAILQPFIDGVEKLVPNCNQNQKDALTDFAYNLGLGSLRNSTLLKTILVNENDSNITFQFNRWVNGSNGEKLPGLVARRAAEAKLYFTPVNNA
jgi:lysozyme